MALRPMAMQAVCKSLKSIASVQRKLSYSQAVFAWRSRQSNHAVVTRLLSTLGPLTDGEKGGNLQTEAEIIEDEQIPMERVHFDTDLLESLLQQQQSDLPLSNMDSPFKKPRRRCFLCKYDVKLDYKNTQLLSQFTSPYTGRIYGRYVTGLCIPMQRRVAQLIERSRKAGFMPFRLKETTFLTDPKLFDPFKLGNKKKYY